MWAPKWLPMSWEQRWNAVVLMSEDRALELAFIEMVTALLENKILVVILSAAKLRMSSWRTLQVWATTSALKCLSITFLV